MRPFGPPLSDKRDRAHRAHVLRDVLTPRPVAARGAAHQPSVLIGQRNAETVDLQLGDIFRRCLDRQSLAHPLIEGPQFLFVVSVIEAEHRLQMLDGVEALRGPAADTLRW